MSSIHATGDLPGRESNSLMESVSNLTVAARKEQSNNPIIAVLIAVFSVGFLGLCVVCYWARKSRRRRLQDYHDVEKGRDDRESDTEESIEDLDQTLTIKEWEPCKVTIHRSQPIHKDDAQNLMGPTTESTDAETPPKTVPLFPDCRGFGDFEYRDSDDSSTYDDDTEDDNGLEHMTDLVDAGVFKRTLRILKEKPRCVLCSVCFKPGDKISVSNNPSCDHQYHQDCIRKWIKTKSHSCPVCRQHYTKRPKPSESQPGLEE